MTKVSKVAVINLIQSVNITGIIVILCIIAYANIWLSNDCIYLLK